MEFPTSWGGKSSNQNESPIFPDVLVLFYSCGNNVTQQQVTPSLKYFSQILDSSRLFSICHFFIAQYISDCQDFVRNTELFNVVILFLMVKEWLILCEIAFLIRHETWYCRIVNLFLDNLGQPQYGVSLSHDIENLVEGRNWPLVPLIYLQCWENLGNKTQIFHSKFMYIPWIWKYCKSKRIHLDIKINARKCKSNLHFIRLRVQSNWNFVKRLSKYP